jgi:cytidine deaminase
MKTSIAGAEICAEAVALAAAAEDGVTDIEAVVVVNRIGDIIAPCGACRELFLDYCPKAEIIVPGLGGGKIMTAAELLPLRTTLLNEAK